MSVCLRRHVAGRGRPHQEPEGSVLVDLVSLHEDADRLADLPARGQRLVEVVLLLGVTWGDGGMGGEGPCCLDPVLLDRVGLCAEKVQSGDVTAASDDPHRGLGEYALPPWPCRAFCPPGCHRWRPPPRSRRRRPRTRSVRGALLSLLALTPDPGAASFPSPLSREKQKPQVSGWLSAVSVCAPVGIRTPNLLIRSQMLYPLSYRRPSRTTARE
jgi:hypothetical protein